MCVCHILKMCTDSKLSFAKKRLLKPSIFEMIQSICIDCQKKNTSSEKYSRTHTRSARRIKHTLTTTTAGTHAHTKLDAQFSSIYCKQTEIVCDFFGHWRVLNHTFLRKNALQFIWFWVALFCPSYSDKILLDSSPIFSMFLSLSLLMLLLLLLFGFFDCKNFKWLHWFCRMK